MPRRLFYIPIALLLVGCASSRIEQRIESLETQLASMQRDQALARTRLDEINRLNQSIFILQDRVEQMALEIEQAQTEIVALEIQPAEEPLIEISSAPAATPVVRQTPPKPAQAKAPASSSGVKRDDAVTAYREAYELLMKGQYRTSREKFTAMLRQHPSHDLSDNAQYWLGEIDYVARDFKAALKAFQRVTTEYPHGNKVPDALLKMAFCYIELGRNDEARENLERILREYSWSDPAKIAKERLRLLGGETNVSAPITEDS